MHSSGRPTAGRAARSREPAGLPAPRPAPGRHRAETGDRAGRSRGGRGAGESRRTPVVLPSGQGEDSQRHTAGETGTGGRGIAGTLPRARRGEQAVKLDKPFTLVLGGGGMKGLAHIGVLRALAERGLTPSAILGTSMGAMIGAAWATGMTIDEMAARGRRLRRRDVFQIAHTDMAFRRMRAPAVYRREPLDAFARARRRVTFDELRRPLLVNTVDLESGIQRIWGTPGLPRCFRSPMRCSPPAPFPEFFPRAKCGRTPPRRRRRGGQPPRPRGGARVHRPIVAVDVGGAAPDAPGPDRRLRRDLYPRPSRS